MKIFGINFGSQLVRTESQAMNTPFLKVGKGNLALPYIQNTVSGKGMVYFGSDNLYPQLINQMYYTSPLHGAIIDYTVNASVGGGYNIKTDGSMAQEVDRSSFLRKYTPLFDLLERDLYMHNRCHVFIDFSDSGKFLKMERVDPSKIRYRFDGGVEYSDDWSTMQQRREVPVFRHGGDNYGRVLYSHSMVTPGVDWYPIPQYTSALNWVFLDGEQSFLHKNNIQNSIFPSVFIRRPKRFGSEQEIKDFKDGLSRQKGAENAGYVGVLSGDGFDNTPEVVSPPTSQNDNLFVQTEKTIKDNICFAHKINPAIVGIKVAGSLGNAQELEMSYAIWEKNVVFPLRKQLENLGNSLLQIINIKGVFEVNEFRAFGEVEISDENNTGSLLNSMSPLLANKVLENLTVNEIRSIAGLKKVEGGDKIPERKQPENQRQ